MQLRRINQWENSSKAGASHSLDVINNLCLSYKVTAIFTFLAERCLMYTDFSTLVYLSNEQALTNELGKRIEVSSQLVLFTVHAPINSAACIQQLYFDPLVYQIKTQKMGLLV